MSKKWLIQKVNLKIGVADVVCLIKRNNRARRISVRIISRDEIVLTIPSHESISKGTEFVQSKREWIRKKTQEMPVNNDLLSFFLENSTIWLDARPRSIQIFFSDSNKNFHYHIESDSILLTLPKMVNKEDCLLSFLMRLARFYLPERLKSCAEKVGMNYSRVRVGNQRSRWGSCSSKKVISLNWRILLLDYEIGDYVLYHELAHLKHMNHSTKYWALLNDWLGEAKKLDKQLSDQGKRLMLLARN